MPTYRADTAVLAGLIVTAGLGWIQRWGGPVEEIRPGDVVVGRYRSRPELLVVKRALAPQDDGWLLASDNPFADAPEGVADVEARALLRYWPLRRLGRVRTRP